MNLLDVLGLSNTQVVRLRAELHQPVVVDRHVHAKVEIKISPGDSPSGTEGKPEFQVGCRVSCEGIVAEGEKEKPLFSMECVMNAAYRQLRGEPISAEVFSANHTSLTRQLYPLLHHHLQTLISQLGLSNIRLPQDLVQLEAKSITAEVSGSQHIH